MPSDERTTGLMAALEAPHAIFQSALGIAADQMREYLDVHRADGDGGPPRDASRLGNFAAGRIDVARFASIFGETQPLASDSRRPIEAALAVIEELIARGKSLFLIDVTPGDDVKQAVDRRLAEIGRAFGAALVFQAVRLGTYKPAQHDALLAAMPFAAWNSAERAIAPPLVIEVDGVDVHGDALASFADGKVKLYLVARGTTAPAPLVRVIAPSVLVQQATTVEQLKGSFAYEGPVVAALVPESAARFTHDPRAGADASARLTTEYTPEEMPRGPLGGRSAAQQRDELGQLAALAGRSAAAMMGAVPGTGPAVPQPTDAAAVEGLTSWLLAQAGLQPGGTGARTGVKAL